MCVGVYVCVCVWHIILDFTDLNKICMIYFLSKITVNIIVKYQLEMLFLQVKQNKLTIFGIYELQGNSQLSPLMLC